MWFSKVPGYIFDKQKTPYLTEAKELTLAQSQYELVAYGVFVGTLYGIIGLAATLAFFENNDLIGKKLEKAINTEIKPILCIGETIDEMNSGKAYDVIEEQLVKGLENLKSLKIEHQTPWQEIYRDTVGQLSDGGIIELAAKYRKIRKTIPRHSH